MRQELFSTPEIIEVKVMTIQELLAKASKRPWSDLPALGFPKDSPEYKLSLYAVNHMEEHLEQIARLRKVVEYALDLITPYSYGTPCDCCGEEIPYGKDRSNFKHADDCEDANVFDAALKMSEPTKEGI